MLFGKGKCNSINEHNANADEIEFTVEMNKFGDLVGHFVIGITIINFS